MNARLAPARRSTLVALLGLLALPAAHGLSPELAISQYTWRSWETDQGLPQNSVRDLAQTPDGYLWIATQAGLARFDGVRFKVWRRAEGDALPSDQVSSLAVGENGTLWVGTLGGLAVYRDRRLENLAEALDFRSQNAEGGEPVPWKVRSLAADAAGHVCVGTAGQGVLRRDEGGLWHHYGEAQGLPASDFRAIEVDGAGGCWAGAIGGGLLHVDAAHEVRRVELPSEVIWALHRSRGPGRGGLWIGTERGLYRLDDGRVSLAAFSGELSRQSVGSLLEDGDGNLWVGTLGGGLDRWNGRRVDALHTLDGGAGPVIWSLLEDREGSVWFGSLSGGLSKLEDGPFVAFGVREGLPTHQVHAVVEAPDGGVYVATNSGGVRHVARNGRISLAGGPPGATVWSLFLDQAHRLWTGTADRGISRIDPDGSVFRLEREAALPGPRIVAVLVDRRGRLWLGGEDGAAVLEETPEGGWRALDRPHLRSHGNVTALLEARDGRLFLATRDGLAVEEAGMLRLLRSEGLSPAPIWTLLEGRGGWLWVGTFGGGMAAWNGERFLPFDARDGLPSDDVMGIVDDGLGYLWLATTNGLVRVPEMALQRYLEGGGPRPTLRIFDRRDGLRSVESYGGSPIATRTSDGHLFFATMAGVVRVDPRQVADPEPPPRVLIESISVDDEPVPLDAPLAPDPREIRIRYTASTLTASSRIRFRYRLEGFAGRWSEVGERREAFFTNLAPGAYRFEVQASDDVGDFHEDADTASLPLVIEPHFFETATFAVFAGSALVLLGFGVQQVRVWRLRRREAELEQVAARAAASVRTLRGLMPICASCKKIRDDAGYWNQLEVYLDQHSEARLSHGLCPDCLQASFEEIEDASSTSLSAPVS